MTAQTKTPDQPETDKNDPGQANFDETIAKKFTPEGVRSEAEKVREDSYKKDLVAREQSAVDAEETEQAEAVAAEQELAEQAASTQNQVGRGYVGNKGKPRFSLRNALGTRKKKAIAALALVGATTAASVVIFLSLLPLKIAHIVTNLEHRFFASSEQAVQQEVDNMFSRYLKKYVLPSMPARCKNTPLSTINRACKAVVVDDDKGLIGRAMQGWAFGRVETDMGERFGFVIEKRGDGYYMKSPHLDLGSGGANVTDFVNNDSVTNIWDSSGFTKASRQEVRQVVRNSLENETFWKRSMYRYKVGKLLEVKYGIKRCIFFCDTRDRFADWKDDKGRDIRKKAYRIVYNQRVLGSAGDMYFEAVKCILDGCDPTTVDEPDSIDTNKVTQEGCQKGCTLNGQSMSSVDVDYYGKPDTPGLLEKKSVDFGDRVKAVALSKRIEKDGFGRVFFDDMTQKVADYFLGKGTLKAEGAAKALEKYLGLIGLIYSLDAFNQFIQNGAPTLQKFAYDINSAQAVQLFSMYRTYADEAKSGHVDATMVGSFTRALSSGTQCTKDLQIHCDPQVGGDAGAEQTPVYNEVFGTPQSTIASAGNLFTGQAAAQSQPSGSNSKATQPKYLCKDNKPVPTGSLTCKDTNLVQTDAAVAILKDVKKVYDPLCNNTGLCILLKLFHTFFKPLIDYIIKFGLALAKIAFGFLFDWMEKLLQYVIKFITEVLINTLLKPMIMVSGEMSGGRTLDIMALGADKSGADYAHNGLGGVLLTNDQVTAMLDQQQREDNLKYGNQSFFARMFDTNSSQSPITKLAMAMPDSQDSAVGSFASILSNPISKFGAIFSGLFRRASAATPNHLLCSGGLKGDCFGVTQYGYPSDDPIFTSDPQEYWNKNCSDGMVNKAYNLWASKNMNKTAGTYAFENPQGKIETTLTHADGSALKLDPKGTNPCLLLQNAAVAASAFYTTDVFSPEEKADPSFNSGGSSTGTGTVAGYQNPLRDVQGLTPQRVDQGVDYGGSGPVYAIGKGKVLNLTNSGWPGGTFVVYQLQDGDAAGKYVFFAENCKLDQGLKIGDSVDSNTKLCTMVDASPHIETGWADGSAIGNALAHDVWGSGVDDTAHYTNCGLNFSNLLQKLGAPAGTIQEGAVQLNSKNCTAFPSW